MDILSSQSHYLLQEKRFLLNELKDSLLVEASGIFIIGRIKKFITLQETFSQEIIATLTNKIITQLQQIFPQHIFAFINEKYFFAIIKNIEKEEQEESVEDIQKVIESLKIFDKATGVTLKLNVSLGVVVFPEEASIAEDIFTKAYFALKSISSTDDRSYIFFREFMENQSLFLQNKDIAKRMKSAFRNNNIFLVFQPVLDSKANNILYHECMLKIEGDDDLLAIDDYIAAAEKFGFIKFIDELVLDLVVAELVKYPDIKLSVNVSSFGIDNPAWLKKAKELLQNRNINSRLIIEINEKIIHKEFKKSVQFIRKIKELGCKVLLDNFGSGYTSFTQLKLLSVDMIKIEGFFIQDIMSNYNSEFFVKSVIEMKHLLKKMIVADFVENKETMQRLSDLGVDGLQGNAIAATISEPFWRK